MCASFFSDSCVSTLSHPDRALPKDGAKEKPMPSSSSSTPSEEETACRHQMLGKQAKSTLEWMKQTLRRCTNSWCVPMRL